MKFTPAFKHQDPPVRFWLWLLVGCLGLGYLLALAVGPRVSDATIARDHLWLENERFGGPFGISLNLDSMFYLLDAQNTRTIFLPAARLQSRPLLSFLAHPLAQGVGRLGLPRLPGASDSFNELLPQYLVFIGFNLLMVITTYLAFVRLMARVALPASARGSIANGPSAIPYARIGATPALLGLLLVSNEVTKAFFYAAHAQMLNLLVPVLAVMAFEAFRRAEARGRDAGLVCLLAGLGVLAYGGFAVLGSSVVMAWLWRGLAPPGQSDGRAKFSARVRLAGQLTGFLLLTLAPYACWVWLVRALTGGFYNHEVAYWHEIVWMADAAHQGWGLLVLNLLSNTLFFVEAALRHWWPAALMTLVLGGLSRSCWRQLRTSLARTKPLLVGCAVVGLSFLALFTVVGYRVERLAMPLAVTGLLALGVWAQALEPLLPPSRRRYLVLTTGVFVTAQMAWMVVKDGPYY